MQDYIQYNILYHPRILKIKIFFKRSEKNFAQMIADMDANVRTEKFLIKVVRVSLSSLALVTTAIDPFSNRYQLVVLLLKTVIHVDVLLGNLSAHQMTVLSMAHGLDGQNGPNVRPKNAGRVTNGELECVWVR